MKGTKNKEEWGKERQEERQGGNIKKKEKRQRQRIKRDWRKNTNWER